MPVETDIAMKPQARLRTPGFLSGGGEAGRLLRARNWSESVLGPPEQWPEAVKATVALCLASPAPMTLWLGRDVDNLVHIYNDASRPLIGSRHPISQGLELAKLLPITWRTLRPILAAVLQGEAVRCENDVIPVERDGLRQTAWFTHAHGPIRDDDGRVLGVLSVVSETTGEILRTRRLALEAALGDELRGLSDPDQVLQTAVRILGTQMEVTRCGSGEVEHDAETFLMTRDWTAAGASASRRRNLAEANPELLELCRRGVLVRLKSATADWMRGELADAGPEAPTNAVVAPLAREGELLGALYVETPEPIAWLEDNEAAIRLVAERVWAALQRVNAERRLRESEARLALATRASGLGIWDERSDDQAVILSPRAREILGLDPHERVTPGDLQSRLLPGDDGEPYSEDRSEGGREYRLRRPDGEIRWVRTHAQSVYELRDGQRVRVRSVGTLEDITDRKTAEAERRRIERNLRESESRLRVAQNAGQIGTFELLPESKRILVSESMCRLWGVPVQPEYDTAELLGRILPGDRPPVEADVNLPVSLDYREYRIIRPDTGEERWMARRGEVITEADGHNRYVGVSYDVTDRKRAEVALQKLNETLEAQVAARTAERDRMWRLSEELMVVADLHGRVTAVNPAWEAVLGWSRRELEQHQMLDLLHPDDRAAAQEAIQRLAGGAHSQRLESRLRRRDGAWRHLVWTAVAEAGFLHALGRDVTEERAAADALRRAEDALRQAQKMEAVGQLTGGIAHDFNNMLAVVIGSLDLAERRLARGDSPASHLANVREGAMRAAALTQRLLAFSRRQPLSPKVLNLNNLVGEMSELLRRTLGETVTLETVLAGGLWPANVDPNQMESALVNLAVNARDAMPEGGRLTVETANLRVVAGQVAAFPDLEPGEYVTISVIDRGAGIPTEIMERVFDPFFTTKPVGKGTGLGLSMVYGFVRQSGGRVAIESEVGVGTRVTICLPREAGPMDADVAPPGPELARGQGEVVLVVEDEDQVRRISVDALSELGYQVHAAANGEEALRLAAHLPSLDLLFTDLVMPGIGGRELAQTMLARKPGTRVLLTTGYAGEAAAEAHPRDSFELLPKPFSIEELAAKVRAALAAALHQPSDS